MNAMSTSLPETGSKPATAVHAGAAGRGRRVFLMLSQLADGVAAIALFTLMGMSFVDVVGRELFNQPLPGTMELTEILMATIIFAVLPSVSHRGEQIAVDLLDGVVPAWLRPAQRIAAHLLGSVTFAVIGWQLWVDAGKLARYGGTTPYLDLPLAPIVQLMSVLAVATALGFLTGIFRPAKEPR